MAIKKLATMGMAFCCSSSISNWEERIQKAYGLKKYTWRDLFHPVIFFGMYNPIDYIKLLLHQGEKTIIWCGSDILQTGWFFKILRKIPAQHICESSIEWGILSLMLLNKDIIQQPLFFGSVKEYPLSFIPSKTPHVFLHMNNNAETESGFYILCRVASHVPEITFHIYGKMKERRKIKNIIYHGHVPEEQFNEEIKTMQGALRLHGFDGFADTVAKSVLLGQYPITRISFPQIDTYKNEEDLIYLLRELKYKTIPNYKARRYYLKLWNMTHGLILNAGKSCAK
mgnify:FL=1